MYKWNRHAERGSRRNVEYGTDTPMGETAKDASGTDAPNVRTAQQTVTEARL
jgi:hypothetical protein